MTKREQRIARRAERRKNRKPFWETGVGKVLKTAGSLISPELVAVVEGASGVGDAITRVREATVGTPEDKRKFEELIIQADAAEATEVTERWVADANSDSWLAQNVRPIVFLSTFVGLVLFTLLDSGTIYFEVEEKWVDLWTSLGFVVFGGYFGSRAVEKVTKMKN